MESMYSSELQAAIQAVTIASKICRSVQGKISDDAMEKKDRSPVTIADYASQAVICRAIRDAFPDDPIVAEEDATDLRTDDNASFRQAALDEVQAAEIEVSETDLLAWIDLGNHDGTAQRFWTLDPIDGTKGFLRKDQYAISLALIVAGEIQVAAVACPNLHARESWDNAQGVILTAVGGQGAQLFPIDLPGVTPQSVRVSTNSKASQTRMCESFESGHSAHGWSADVCRHLETTADPVRLDSQAKYAVVARGEADAYIRLPTRADYQEKIWDHAGGVLVVQEAGGTVTDIDGKPLEFTHGTKLAANRGVVVSNGLVHQDLLNAIAATEPSSSHDV